MWLTAKLLIATALLWLLFRYDLIDFAHFSIFAISPGALLGAFLLTFSTVVIGAWRWQILLSALGAQISFLRIFSVTLVGQFFNVFLPGAYGGDIVRASLLYRQVGKGISTIVMSSVTDRLTGIVGLISLAILFIPLLTGFTRLWVWVAAIVCVTGAVIAPVLLVTYASELNKALERLPGRLGRIVHVTFSSIISMLRLYLQAPRLVFFAIILSVIQWLFLLEVLRMIGGLMGFESISILVYYAGGIAGMFGNALPVSPGGLGVGESAFAHTIMSLSSETESNAPATIFLIFRTLTISVSFIGIVPFLFFRGEIKALKDLSPTKGP